MENLSGNPEPKKGMNMTFVAAFVVGAILIGGALFGLLRFRGATVQEQKSQILEGAYREGSPEFEALTKRIVVETDEATQATTPLGAIVMTVRGKIRNNSEKAITALEVKLSIIDVDKKSVKDKIVVVVPNEKFTRFEAKQEMDLTVSVDGFKQEDDRAGTRWKVTAIKVE